MSTHRVELCRLLDLPTKRGRRFVVEGNEIVAWRSAGGAVAAVNSCPHQHIPTLHQGFVEHGEVTCPMHGWTFALDTGEAVIGSGRLRLYPVEIIGGRVFVEIHDGPTGI